MSADTTQLAEKLTDHSKPFTVKLHEDSFRTHNCEMPTLEAEVTKDGLLGMYKQMQTMRRMEMAADALYKAKLIRGFCHLAIGQVRAALQFTQCWHHADAPYRKPCRSDSRPVSQRTTV